MVQACGRLGRDAAQSAVFITVHEKKASHRGKQYVQPREFKTLFTVACFLTSLNKLLSATPAERAEYKLVKGAFNNGECVRRSLYQSFKVENVRGWWQVVKEKFP